MRHALTFVFCACTLLTGIGPLRAQIEVEVLKAVPDSALGVVVINRLKDTSDRLEKLGRHLQVGIPSPLGFAKAIAGVTDGVDEQGSLAIALFSADGGKQPVGALFIPVNDYAKFLAPLKALDPEAEVAHVTFFNRPALVAHKEGFAVLVDSKQEKLLHEIKDSATGIQKLAEPLDEWFAGQAVVGLALGRGTHAMFDWMYRAGEQGKTAGRAPAKREVARATTRIGVERMKSEITHCGAGIELADRGVILGFKAALKSDGQIAQEIEKTKWPASPGLDALPAGNFVFAAAGALPRSWLVAMAHAKLALLEPAVTLNEGQQKQLDQAMADMVQPIQSVAMLLRPPAAARSVLNQLAPMLIVNDARATLAAYEKGLQTLETLRQESKSKPVVSNVKKIDLEGMPALEMAVDLSGIMAEAKEPDSPAATILGTLVGAERQFTVYLAVVDEHRIAVSYGSRTGVLETAKAVRAGKLLTIDPNVQKAIAMLPEKSSWIGLADMRGVMQVVNTVLPTIAADARKLPEFPSTVPVVARTQWTPLVLEARVVLPTELIGKLGGYIAKVRQLQQED